MAQTLSEQTRKTNKINPKIVQIQEAFNVRDFSRKEIQEGLVELSKSIAEVGVRVPIMVKFDKEQNAWLVDGERRLRATLMAIKNGAQIETIPCTIQPPGSNEADSFFYQRLNNDGVRFTALEDSQWIVRMLGFGWEVSTIAKKWGKNPQDVVRLVDLAEAPEEIKALVKQYETGEGVGVSSSFALDTIKAVGAEKAKKVLADAVEVAKAAGANKATKKHSVLAEPKVEKEPETVLKQKDFLTKEESREAIELLKFVLGIAKKENRTAIAGDIEDFFERASVV